MKPIVQYLIVSADNPELATERAIMSLIAKDGAWFDTVDHHSELPAKSLNEGVVGELMSNRFNNFGKITDGLDPQHVAAAIWAYSDDSSPGATPGILNENHKAKFDLQKQKMIDAINFVDDVWGPLSHFYDADNSSTSVENLKARAQEPNVWAVPLVFHPSNNGGIL